VNVQFKIIIDKSIPKVFKEITRSEILYQIGLRFDDHLSPIAVNISPSHEYLHQSLLYAWFLYGKAAFNMIIFYRNDFKNGLREFGWRKKVAWCQMTCKLGIGGRIGNIQTVMAVVSTTNLPAVSLPSLRLNSPSLIAMVPLCAPVIFVLSVDVA